MNGKYAPAFPIEKHWNVPMDYLHGISVRDYFAAKALAACPLHQIEDKAKWAYRMADAMLEARK